MYFLCLRNHGSQTQQTSGIKLLAVNKMQIFMDPVFERIFVDQIRNSFSLSFYHALGSEITWSIDESFLHWMLTG